MFYPALVALESEYFSRKRYVRESFSEIFQGSEKNEKTTKIMILVVGHLRKAWTKKALNCAEIRN